MQGGSKLRIGLVTGAIALAAIIYLLPKTPVSAKTENQPEAQAVKATTFSIESLLASSKPGLGWENERRVDSLEQQLNSNNNSLSVYDSIAAVWDKSEKPGIAAWYFEKKAEKAAGEKDWLNTAYRYFDAYKSAKDSLEAAFFLEKAIEGYTMVLEKNPHNLDAKTDMGVLYAEGTAEPMKGIMLLREVIAENPLHENAQLNLGFLSMKSGQYEKALERFKKVLEINPSRIDMHIYLGETYVRLNDKKKAIENFMIFKNLSNDQQMNSQVDQYIASLKEK
jgi:tetratricopeptide (TPR) repeat protein